MEFESKLIPILREGVDVVKIITYKKVKDHLIQKYCDHELPFINRLTGAVVNELFGTPNTTEPFASFKKENQEDIHAEVENFSSNFEELRIPLTDALRIQFFCDSQEGVEDCHVLSRAQELDILIEDREIPLPAVFMELVRNLGSSFNIIVPQIETLQ
jgi:hypothetical protein